jgi:xylulokinase
MAKVIGAIDVGTTGCRTILFNLEGKEISRHYEEWSSIFPSPVMVEQDANHWWSAVKTTIQGAIKKGNVKPEDIISVSITNQRETIVPVDKNGKPLHNALVWQDRRTTAQCEQIRQKLGIEKVYNTTGLTTDPYFSSSKIMWIKENKPEIYQNAHKFLLVADYILFKLTGKFATDYSNASRTMLFDIRKLKWSDEMASGMGLDIDKMPEAVPSGQVIGNVISEDSGLAKSTKVIAGAGDQQCAALGVGVVKPGRIKCTTGTGSFILAYLDEPKFDPERRVLCSCAAVPGKYVQEASIFTTGSVLRWARDNFAIQECQSAKQSNIDPYDLMTEKAKNSKIGAKGLILVPHFVGAGAPHWNPYARGIMFGLALGHTTADIYRAIMEGVCYEVKKSVKVFQQLGVQIAEMRITGGGSRSELWNQIMADVLGIKCGRGEMEESTAVGAAILAAYGAGEYKDLAVAAENIAHINKFWNPNPEAVKIYDKTFKIAEQLYETINKTNIYRELSEITE